VTRLRKRSIGILAVLVVGLAGAGFVVLHRGSGSVAISAGRTAAGTEGDAAGVPASASGATTSPSSPVASATSASKTRTTAAKTQAGEARPKKTVAKKAPVKKPVPVTTIGPKKISAKKGASVWKQAGLASSLTSSGVSWMYDWAASPNGMTAPKGVEFVPMIWGKDSVDAATLKTAKKSGSTLLGFNEPDLGAQSNLTVDQALDLWPKLEATKMRLGSPAVAWGADQSGQWLDRFMTGAKSRGYRVDFITLHWYGSDFTTANAVSQLQGYVKATYARYHKPIWITEYALMNFGGTPKLPSAARQAAFVTKSTAMLQKLSYVERYAWFAFPTSTDGTDGTGLYRPGNIPTAMGKAYRAAG
jgi:hypothetical protein